jgi:glycosyltransferase involved in cell wall biosynthesis
MAPRRGHSKYPICGRYNGRVRILFTAGRELGYQRNEVVLRALRRFARVEVVGSDQPASISLRSLQLLPRLLPRLATQPYDLVYVGFYGYWLLPFVRLMTRRAVVFDAFVSNYDTLCFDRRRFAPRSPIGRLTFQVDRSACRAADKVLLDTPQHAEFFAQTFHLAESKLASLPVGCNEDIFHPGLGIEPEQHTILYYATYQPLHGIETVVRAMACLKQLPRLRLRLIGAGPGSPRIRQLVRELQLDNVDFLPGVPLQRLPGEIAAAGICLGGHFGVSDKAGRVIPGKVYQILAMGQPLIAADAPANRALLTHLQTAYLCPPGDPQALASAIEALYQSDPLRQRLADSGRALYRERCSEAIITARLQELLTGLSAG